MGKNKLKKISSNIIANLDTLSTLVTDGLSIMDKLQAVGIKEATFENGMYFRAGKKNRAIVKNGLLVAETETDYICQFPKEDVTSDDIVTADDFHLTQKMRGAYGNQSQSSVSKKRKKKKKK